MFSFAFSLPLTNPVLIFSVILFIILLAPILLHRLKIPDLIGLIIAGAVIGPNGLGIIQSVHQNSQGLPLLPSLFLPATNGIDQII